VSTDELSQEWITQLREIEPNWRTQFGGWKTVLGEQAAIKFCLSATRPGLLFAASRREARGRRGEAVLAAMKIEYGSDLTDNTKLAPGGLPLALVNKVIQIDGRMVFNVNHSQLWRSVFFRHYPDDSRVHR
jgi:hypothetical protein